MRKHTFGGDEKDGTISPRTIGRRTILASVFFPTDLQIKAALVELREEEEKKNALAGKTNDENQDPDTNTNSNNINEKNEMSNRKESTGDSNEQQKLLSDSV